MSSYTVPFVINGEERIAEKTFDVISPDTCKAVHQCGVATEKDALEAVDAAVAAGREWRNTPPAARRDILFKAAEIMTRRREELGQYMMDETGGARGWADFNLDVTIDMLKETAGRVSSLTGSVPTLQDPNQSAMVVREPFGVVLAMAPWNAPYILGTRSILFPIAAGCTAVFKGSESAPRTMHGIVSVLQEAGLPKGVLNYITTDPKNAPSVVESLIANPNVKKINFTGSTAIGRIINKLAGQHLKPTVMELGGKAPAIVWEDANVETAATQCTLGAFLFGGQVCMSTEKIIVHKKIGEQFQKKLVETIEAIFPSKGDAPVLINGQSVEKNKNLLKDAVSKGASLLNGDLDAEESTKTRMRPIVVGKVTPDMDIYQNESFGPTVSLIEVETEEEALRIANDTEYGLTSAVFTEDLRTGFRLAKGIEAGAVHINSMSIHDEMALPHGGAKASGFGRFNNSFGLDEYVRTKSITWMN
ncbi:Uu.00g034380.m01.CDS01 [Anthostomella pinea]|uniref:Uu.00g034380.m01.CDS01 n=1 Tax=Anthostomella pinea TaxID=933095 RepID=A0AAI8V918_9PEZI|nr:Uu.00g034380.m01.CDS01 [Anthostomella pinea]